jgi:hypothetical protein
MPSKRRKPSLDNCWERIKRADETIRRLNREIAIFRKRNPYTLIRQTDANPNNLTYRLVDIEDVPPRFSILAGEVIHHCRASLDMLMYQLVLAAPKAIRVNPETVEHPKVAFPIFVNRPKKYKTMLNAHICRVSKSAGARIAALQPCKRGNGGRSSFLALFHEMDLIDKHRLLAAMAVGYEMPGLPLHALKPGAVFTINLGVPFPPEMEVNMRFTPEIAFNEPRAFRGKAVIPTLMEVSHFTSYTLSLFAGEFA